MSISYISAIEGSVRAETDVRDRENPTPDPTSIAHGIERVELYHGANTSGDLHAGRVISVVMEEESV